MNSLIQKPPNPNPDQAIQNSYKKYMKKIKNENLWHNYG